jgi:tripartite-type tricarboxylate transporter receptor subunit TctC
MRLARRKFLQVAAGAVSVPMLSRIAKAETYPSRPVRIVVGFPAGNAPDIVAWLIGQQLSDRLGQKFFTENRPGAGTNFATEGVVRSPADGYTLLLASSSNTVNAALYSNLNFDFVRDIASVAMIGITPFVMVVNPTIPARTIPEFIAYAKANPGKLSMASPGIGTTTHLFGELFKMLSGVDWVHVPYRNSFFPDLISGQVQVSFTTIAGSLALIREGKLRALGVTTSTRSPVLSDVHLSEISSEVTKERAGTELPHQRTPPVISCESSIRRSTRCCPITTSKRDSPNWALNQCQQRSDFASFIVADAEKWAQVIRTANIKPA